MHIFMMKWFKRNLKTPFEVGPHPIHIHSSSKSSQLRKITYFCGIRAPIKNSSISKNPNINFIYPGNSNSSVKEMLVMILRLVLFSHLKPHRLKLNQLMTCNHRLGCQAMSLREYPCKYETFIPEYL